MPWRNKTKCRATSLREVQSTVPAKQTGLQQSHNDGRIETKIAFAYQYYIQNLKRLKV